MKLDINDVVQINHHCGLGDLVLNTYGMIMDVFPFEGYTLYQVVLLSTHDMLLVSEAVLTKIL